MDLYHLGLFFVVVTAAYMSEPQNTIPAPARSPMFQSLLNIQTLRHKLSAFLVVRARFVETELTREVSWFTPVTHTNCEQRLTTRTKIGLGIP